HGEVLRPHAEKVAAPVYERFQVNSNFADGAVIGQQERFPSLEFMTREARWSGSPGWHRKHPFLGASVTNHQLGPLHPATAGRRFRRAGARILSCPHSC
ncbi:MAG: hypothetical protein ACYTEO_08110, partial [Planctomycetota bacterium]